MSRNASGTYSLPAGNPVSPGTTIDASWANTTLEDIGNEITNSLSRTGAGGMLAPFRIDDGAVTTPGLSFLNETNSGLYRASSGNVRLAISGVDVVQLLASGVIVPAGKTMTMNGNATVGGTLASTGAVTFASTLAVTGVLSANGGLTGNVTSAGTSTFNNVTISGSLDMDTGSSATITGLTTPTNPSDAASKQYVDNADGLLLPKTGGTMSGAIEMSSNKVTGLGTPTTDNDAANKLYVDQVAQGLDAKASCRVATTGSITLSGTQTIDGVAVIASDRVLVKDQATASQNGIYVVAAGSWTRSTDADTWNELVKAFTFVEEGTVNANNGFICTVAAGGTLGSTSVTWTQFSGAGQITAGTGMTKTGNTLNVNTASASRIVVGADEIDLATTGVSANTYKSVTVDAYGRVTAGSNPTTLSGYGITDAYTQAQTDTLLNAKLSLSGGTMSGSLAMGSQPITGLQDPTNAQDAVTLNYVTTLFGSTSAAAQSATDAANSATDAQTYANNASSSATDATNAKNAAEAAYDSFDDRYLGVKSSDPTTDNDGDPLVTGALYFNSTSGVMKVYDGSAWNAVATTPGGSNTQLQYNSSGSFAGASITTDGSNLTIEAQGDLRLADADSSNYVALQAPGTVATNVTLTLPDTAGSNGQALTTDGNGALSWSTVAGSPGGSDTQLQFNNAGSFGGASGLVTDGSNLTLNAQGDLRFADSDSSNWVAFQAPATVASNITWTLPDADGTDGQVIKTNGSGTLSWVDQSGGGGGGGTSVTVTQATATASQTTFNVTYTVGQLSVYLNGALLSSSDYTASNGTTVVLASGAASGDIFTALAYSTVAGLDIESALPYLTAVGSGAGAVNTGVNNVFVGFEAGNDNSTGTNNVAVGHQALDANTTGGYNTAVGSSALGANIGGLNNTAVGDHALDANTSGNHNVALGRNALGANTTGSSNIAIGLNALETNSTGGNNVAIGVGALNVNTVSHNTAIGDGALAANTTGADNTAVGWKAADAVTTAADITAIGRDAGGACTTGTDNTFLGANAGANLTTGTSNVFLGRNCSSSSSSDSGQIVVGANVTSQGTEYVTIGTGAGKIYNAFTVNATWTQTSDERLKRNIQNDTLGLSFINRLRPVTYQWKPSNEIDQTLPYYNEVNQRNTETVMHGLVAQEVKAALDAEGVSTFAGWDVGSDTIQAVSREMFISPLIKAIQELSAKCDSLQAEINTLKGQ